MKLAQDVQADRLLEDDPFALMVGMLLDQQQPMERAFLGPYRVCRRLGWQRLDPGRLLDLREEDLVDVMKQTPAVHRFPTSMAGRILSLAQAVVRDYGGDCTKLWSDPDAQVVLDRLLALPGFGPAKARIFLALLGKQRGVRPQGWREVSSPYGEEGACLSVADVVDEESLKAVRATKRQMKAQAS